MIKLENIKVIFNKNTNLERTIIEDISLEVSQGEFITVIGSNGAGKSTILNVISGDIFPDQGKVIIKNKDTTNQKNYERAKFIAKVVQDPKKGTITEMTIEENLAFAMLRGKKRDISYAMNKNNRTYFIEQLKTLDMKLEDRLNVKVNELSGGQRQALSLIMACLNKDNTEILLLDEHTAALDPKTAEKIMELTDKIIKEYKLSSMMITHNMAHALYYGDRTILLHEGKIIKTLSKEEKLSMKPSDLAELFNEI